MDIKEKKLNVLIKWFLEDFNAISTIEGVQDMINKTAQKIEKKIMNSDEDDLLSVLNLVMEKFHEHRLEEEKQLDTQFYFELYIIIKSFVALIEENGYLAKKNFLEITLKVHISSILNELLKLDLNSVECRLNIILFLVCGFPLWRKTGDHVPELYRAFKNSFTFFQHYFEEKQPNPEIGIKVTQEQNPENLRNLLNKFLIGQTESKSIDEANVQTFSIFLSFFQNSIKLTNMDPNFEIIHQSILNNLKQIALQFPTKSNLFSRTSQLTTQLEGWFEDYQKKVSLDIILEQPLYQIKQLTPQMRDNHEISQVQERQILKKQITQTQKSLIKEIQNDHLILHKEKLDGEEQQRIQNQASYKQFITLMDEQHKEIKRMQSTQLNVKRNQKHSNRMSGNQMG